MYITLQPKKVRYAQEKVEWKQTVSPDIVLSLFISSSSLNKLIEKAYLSHFPLITVLKCLRLSQDPVTLELKRGNETAANFLCKSKMQIF